MKLVQEPEMPKCTDGELLQIQCNCYLAFGEERQEYERTRQIIRYRATATLRKKQLHVLSMIATSHTKKELQQLIPNASIHEIDKAQKHAGYNGPGLFLKKCLFCIYFFVFIFLNIGQSK